MVSDRTRELLFPLTILVSVAVGVVIGGSFGRTMTRTTTDSSPGNVDSKAIVEAVEGLRMELVRTREKLEMNPLPAPAAERVDSRSPAGAPDVAAELRKMTEQLVQAAESLRNAGNRASGDRAPLVPPAVVDPNALAEMLRTPDENKRKHQLWTYQQVMDRYGAPDSIGETTKGMYWEYDRGEASATFNFVDGRVIWVNTSP